MPIPVKVRCQLTNYYYYYYYSITEVTRFRTPDLAYAAGNKNKLAPLRLRIPNLADRNRGHLLLFIC